MKDENPWIPMEEMLPPFNQTVLFWRRRKQNAFAMRWGAPVLPFAREVASGWIGDNGVIHFQHYLFDPNAPDQSVFWEAPSHWMPLIPAPPGERYMLKADRGGA